jgi:hypothetical protein
MALLSRDEVFANPDLMTEDVPCPEWGGDIRVRALTGEERDAYEASMLDQSNGKQPRANLRNMRAKLIVRCAIDEHGAKLFSPGDVTRLGQRSAAPIDRLYEACTRLSGMSDKDVEELEENFESDPSESSTSV